MSLAPTVAALARTTIFGSLDEAALQRVADESVEASYRPGAVVFAQGDPGDCLYVVTSGRLKLQVRIRGLDTLMLTTLRAPDTFGELAVIDRGPRSATVVALEPSTLLAVARSTVLALLSDRPEVTEALLRGLGATVRRLTEQAADLALLDLTGRVAKLLVTLGDQQLASGADERGRPGPRAAPDPDGHGADGRRHPSEREPDPVGVRRPGTDRGPRPHHRAAPPGRPAAPRRPLTAGRPGRSPRPRPDAPRCPNPDRTCPDSGTPVRPVGAGKEGHGTATDGGVATPR